MAFVIKECPATFEFELSDGTVHSMPVPAALGVERMLKLRESVSLDKVDGVTANAAFREFIDECCPELEGVEMSGYVVGQIAQAWYQSRPE